MYFEIEDYKPDITPVGSAISWREGVLLSVIVHLTGIIAILMSPELFRVDAEALRARQAALIAANQKSQPERFVFVNPRVDLQALKPPPRAEASDRSPTTAAPD